MSLRKRVVAGSFRKRKLPREQLEQQGAEAEDVRRPGNVLEQALFRRDVRVRSNDARRPLLPLDAGGAEIDQDRTTVPPENDVGRSEVEVDEAPGVHMLQRRAEMDGNPERVGDAEPSLLVAVHEGAESGAVDELDEELGVLPDLEQAHDVGVVERG